MPGPVRSRVATPRASAAGVLRSTPTTVPTPAPTRGTSDVVDGMDHGGRPELGVAHRGARGGARGVVVTPTVSFVNGGFVVDGRSSHVAAGVTQSATRVLYAAAEQIGREQKNPFSTLTTKERAAMSTHLLPFLSHDSATTGRSSSLAVRARASSYALLVDVASSMRTERERGGARGLIDALLHACAHEKNPGLRRQMAVGLLKLPRSLLLAKHVRGRDELLSHAVPSAPPYDEWFKAGKPSELKVKQFVQDEFWKSEIAEYRKQGYKVVVDADGMRASALRVIEDPKKKAPPTTVFVDLVQSDENVLRDMDDSDVNIVLYTGHANLGAVTKWSLDDAPNGKGDKLIGLFACRTKQNLSAVRRRFDDAHVMVSRLGTYGHDDRLAIHGLFEGIAARKSYEDIGRPLKGTKMWERDNYFLPNDLRQLDNADLDGDGVMDRSGSQIDALYSVDVKKGRSERITMKPSRSVVDLATIPGERVVDAVEWFNTVWFYWTEEFGTKAEHGMADRFRANGWFTSDDPTEVVRIVKSPGHDGKPVYLASVNAAYRDQSADALGMMVCFSLGEKMLADVRPDESQHERRLRALSMVASYVYNLVEHGDMADHLVRIFARRFGFPESLTWPVMAKACASDPKFDASPKIVRALEKGMQYPFLEVNPTRSSVAFREYIAEALSLLEKSDTDIGRETFEIIVSGGVTVDELADLTRADFMHIRKEFAREGTDLPVADFARLHDPQSRSARAITTSVNGYMWDDRIYVARTLTPKELAVTLVHEVNHVRNRSEESYRGESAILVEEYRAHYAEALFEKKPVDDETFCRKLKEEIIENYGLKTVSPDDVPDVPPGIL